MNFQKYINQILQYLIFLTEAHLRLPWPAGLVRRIGPRWERERERGPHLHSVDDRGGSGELDRHLAQTATSCTWRRVALDVGEGGSGSCSLGSRLPTRTDGSVAAHAELGLRRHDAWSSDAELGSSELGMVRKDMATVKLRKSPAAGSCTRRTKKGVRENG
jgi:hypothetical protein